MWFRLWLGERCQYPLSGSATVPAAVVPVIATVVPVLRVHRHGTTLAGWATRDGRHVPRRTTRRAGEGGEMTKHDGLQGRDHIATR